MTTAQRILELLAASPNALITPAEIIVRLNITEATAYKTLNRMRTRGQISRCSWGAYHAPGKRPATQHRPGRKLLWSRLLELEERVAKLEVRAP